MSKTYLVSTTSGEFVVPESSVLCIGANRPGEELVTLTNGKTLAGFVEWKEVQPITGGLFASVDLDIYWDPHEEHKADAPLEYRVHLHNCMFAELQGTRVGPGRITRYISGADSDVILEHAAVFDTKARQMLSYDGEAYLSNESAPADVCRHAVEEWARAKNLKPKAYKCTNPEIFEQPIFAKLLRSA